MPPTATITKPQTAAPPTKAPVRRNIALLVAMVLLFQLVAVAAVEGVLFLAGIGEEDISKFDPELGFMHRTNKRVTWRKEGYSQSYFDADGLREGVRTVAKPAGVYRVLLLGDSYIEGLQEPPDNSFGKMLERQLSKNLGRPVEVINFGTVGYSTVQEYLLLKRMMPKYEPDSVLLCYTPRDMAETVESWAPSSMKPMGSRPYAIKVDGNELQISNEPVLNNAASSAGKWAAKTDWLKQSSHLFDFFTANKPKLTLHNSLVELISEAVRNPSAIWESGAKSSFKIQFYEAKKTTTDEKTKKVETQLKKHEQLNQDPTGLMRKTHLRVLDDTFASLLQEMNSLCQKGNARLMVCATPSRVVLYPDSVPPTVPAPYNVTYDEELQFVEKSCSAQHVPMLNCQAAAKGLSKEEIGQMYYQHHPNKRGNQFLCDQVSAFLTSQLRP